MHENILWTKGIVVAFDPRKLAGLLNLWTCRTKQTAMYQYHAFISNGFIMKNKWEISHWIIAAFSYSHGLLLFCLMADYEASFFFLNDLNSLLNIFVSFLSKDFYYGQMNSSSVLFSWSIFKNTRKSYFCYVKR